MAVITKIMVNQVEGVFGFDKAVNIAKAVSAGRNKVHTNLVFG